jgi:hypothetical protein
VARRYTKLEIDQLINDTENFIKLHPEKTRNQILTLKRYYRKQAGMEQEPGQGRLYKTWEVSAFNKNTEQWETTTNHGYEYTPDPDALAEVFEPATPAKITPTRRKRLERVGKQLLIFGDSQIGYHRLYDADGNDYLHPTHSEEALSVLTQINAHERPDYVVNLSDTVDLAEFGRFDPQSDSFHRTLSPAFQRAHDLYAQLFADNPDARLIEIDSNHTTRVNKNLMRKMPEMYGFTLPGEDYPLMSYYRLANLAPLGVEFIAGYGAAEYVHGEEYGNPIIFKHGVTTSSNAGATVKKEASQNPTVSVVRGHGHSFEYIQQTNRQGDVLHYMQLGTTCDTKGSVPSYHSAMDDHGHPVKYQENWQQQLLMIEDFEDGTYTFNVIDIINGIARFRGREYKGE